jgi:hypothetical protein
MKRIVVVLPACFILVSAATGGVPSTSSGTVAKAGRAQHHRADWPYYRHDPQLTGRSPGKGNMARAPREKWKLYIGGWSGLITVKHRAAANGEVRLGVSFGEDYLAKTGAKWDSLPLVDLAGDGKLVPAPPGKVAKLLPGVKGLQQVIWEFVPGQPNTARGRCYSFADGADRPKLVWETEPEKEVYEMLWAVADMDGDGKPEKVEVKCSISGPQGARLAVQGGSVLHREVLINIDAAAARVQLTGCEGVVEAHYLRRDCAPLPSLPMPMVADLDGDGTNELIVQDAHWTTRVLSQIIPRAGVPGRPCRQRWRPDASRQVTVAAASGPVSVSSNCRLRSPSRSAVKTGNRDGG